jgi:hypothetical protein
MSFLSFTCYLWMVKKTILSYEKIHLADIIHSLPDSFGEG